jgi:hypothetical protein
VLILEMLLFICVVIGAASLAYYVSHRWIVGRQAGDSALSYTAVQILRITAALLSFLVALTFSRVSQNRERLIETLEIEAAQLNDIFEDTQRLSAGDKSNLSDLVMRYINSLVEDEWPALAESDLSPVTEALFSQLEEVALNLDDKSHLGRLLQGRILQDLDEISDLRQERLNRSQAALPGFFLLVTLGYILIALLMGVHVLGRAQCFFFAFCAAFVGAVLFMIVSMSTPCAGVMRVDPRAFIKLLDRLEASVTPAPTPSPQVGIAADSCASGIIAPSRFGDHFAVFLVRCSTASISSRLALTANGTVRSPSTQVISQSV